MQVGGSSGGVRSEINVTPLVDVVLVLLIIFMVITPMLQVGYEVNTPPEVESAVPPPSEDQIILRLDEEGRIFINRETILPSEFPQRLEATLHNRESKMVFFAAAGELPFGKVAEFLDLCRNSGAKNLGIVFDELSATPAAASAVGVTAPQ
jgi:biopolymer transport protein TolR